MLRTIRASKSSTDGELAEICKKELGDSECQIEPGPQTETIYQTSPPANTLAVVVDISNTGGALKVHQKSDNSWGNIFIGMVGSGDDDENIRNLVIVPWDAGWHYRTIGNIKIKYIIKK
ncbi:hypothetical protein ACJ73_08144 [Blastomyces percursus]|uniref:Uncharacterized protein n=1 Tax=Blastomyces percursus TaxID=1658174 RepID=A0A1J9PVW8_9EURO|nr:hypothetical protein ACJ73_08144 [Blastomyces percursus]